MSRKFVITTSLLFVAVAIFSGGQTLELKARAYENLVISLTDAVPAQNCKTILTNLEVSVFKIFITSCLS